MISKSRIKYIKSLQIKKYRKQEQCFAVEGRKSMLELLSSDFEITMVVATNEFLSEYANRIPSGVEITEVSLKELEGLGEFQTNDSGIAVARMQPNEPLVIGRQEFALVLDDIRDPGNLGTIIRTADWYGINNIIASSESADVYNAKVISATMGSFTRVKVFYTELVSYLDQTNLSVFGTFLNGENVHDASFGEGGLIVIGNEAQGISKSIERFVTRRITIPRFGKAESLNAAIATSIVLDNLKRDMSK